MAEQAIRFSVCSDNGFRASTWKCWTPSGKEDVYLTCRELGGMLKVSLHESGRWHFAYDQSFFERSVSETDRTERGRYIDSWLRPSPLAAGHVISPVRAYSRRVGTHGNSITRISIGPT